MRPFPLPTNPSRQRLPFFLVLAVHYFTDWATGANVSLLQLSTVQLEILFLVLTILLYLTFLFLTPKYLHQFSSEYLDEPG